MSKPPSAFLQFLKDTAKPVPNSDDIAVHVSISPKGLQRIIDEAEEHEDFYSSADSEVVQPEPDATEGDDDGSTPPNDSSILSIRDEAKKGLANLTDKRTALQTIIAIANKHLGSQ